MMKAITYKGVYSPILRNNGVEITIRVQKGPAKGGTQIVPYAEFSGRQQKMLARNKTCVETKKVKSYLNPDGPEIEIPVDTPASCDPSTELYWSM